MPQILKLTPECLSIQYDASAKMIDLINQLKLYHLYLTIDYEIPPHAHNTPKPNYIIVRDPSKVVRALYSIPIELWTEDLPSRDQLINTRLHYVSKLHERNCYYFDLMFVRQANQEWLHKIHHFAQDQLKHHTSLLKELLEVTQKPDSSPLHQPIYILSLVKIHQFLQDPSLHTDKIKFTKAVHQWKAYNDHLSQKDLAEWSMMIQKSPIIEPTHQTSQEDQATQTSLQPESRDRITETEETITPLIHELIHHRTRILKRIQNNSWFQDLNRNQAKMAALNCVIDHYAKLPREEWILKVRENHAILTGSTSNLPRFFRGKVATQETLTKIEQVLQISTQGSF